MPHLTSFDGTTITYSAIGEEQAPVVVLVHGFASDAAGNWLSTGIAPAIASAGWRVVLPDARGHGSSGKPHDPEAYRPPAMARDVSAVLDDLGCASADLVGYSLGSTTAITVASLDRRVRRLVLGGAGATLLAANDAPHVRRRQLGAAVLELSDEDAASLTDPAGIGLRTFVVRGGGDRLALAAAMRAEEGLTEAALAITNPTLVLTGRDDVGSGDPAALASVLANGSWAWLDGDHLGAVRDPAFVSRVLAFLGAP